MFYSPLVKKACLIAFRAHKQDVDKGGYPYIMHPYYLAFRMQEEDAVCVALLHDVIEDHGDEYSFAYLEKEGFTQEIINALKLLTHDPAVPYMEYVKAIGTNALARKVKIEDLKHNLDPSRLEGKRTQKSALYEEALSYLLSLA